MAGRKPKPTALKKLEGNPGKRKLNKKEPIPAKCKGRKSDTDDKAVSEERSDGKRCCH